MTMEKHFVEFYSPGTLVAEVTSKPIESWDVDAAVEMARHVMQRYNATPYGFQFTTRSRTDDELDSKVTAKSPMYFLGGKIETLEEVEARNDPNEKILLSNMKSNGYARIVVNDNSWRWTQPLDDGDVALDFTPPDRTEKAEALADDLENQIAELMLGMDDAEAALKRALADGAAKDAVLRTVIVWAEKSRSCDYLTGDDGRTDGCDGFGDLEAIGVRVRQIFTDHPGATLLAVVRTATSLHKLVDELCTSVDAAGDDVGGHRGSLTILHEVGPADTALGEALDNLDRSEGKL